MNNEITTKTTLNKQEATLFRLVSSLCTPLDHKYHEITTVDAQLASLAFIPQSPPPCNPLDARAILGTIQSDQTIAPQLLSVTEEKINVIEITQQSIKAIDALLREQVEKDRYLDPHYQWADAESHPLSAIEVAEKNKESGAQAEAWKDYYESLGIDIPPNLIPFWMHAANPLGKRLLIYSDAMNFVESALDTLESALQETDSQQGEGIMQVENNISTIIQQMSEVTNTLNELPDPESIIGGRGGYLNRRAGDLLKQMQHARQIAREAHQKVRIAAKADHEMNVHNSRAALKAQEQAHLLRQISQTEEIHAGIQGLWINLWTGVTILAQEFTQKNIKPDQNHLLEGTVRE